MNDIVNCLYEFIDEIDNSEIGINIDKLKNEIYEDKELYEKLKDFNNKKDGSDIYLDKISLYNNDKIKKYLYYENNLNYIILELNKKLNKLIDKKGCM